MTDEKKCSICGRLYSGYGNNAYPVNEGRCCDECNEDWVIPTRLRALFFRGAKTTIIAVMFGIAVAANASAGCLLCDLGHIVEGMNGQQTQQQQLQQQLLQQPVGPQFHTYQFPGGRTLNCTTMLAGTPSATTTCN